MRLVKLNPMPRDGRQAFNIIRSRVSRPMVAIYHVGERHLECAPEAGDPRSVERKYGLDSRTIEDIKREVGNDVHVILAYDFQRCEVYIIDAVPELQIASAVLTVLFAEMVCGCAPCDNPCKEKEPCDCEEEWVDEDEDTDDEPWDDDEGFDEMFNVTHANNRDEDYLGGLKRLKPSFELTF